MKREPKAPCERCGKVVRKDDLRECRVCGTLVCVKCNGKKACTACEYLKKEGQEFVVIEKGKARLERRCEDGTVVVVRRVGEEEGCTKTGASTGTPLSATSIS